MYLAPDIRLFILLDHAVGKFLWRTGLARFELQIAAWVLYIGGLAWTDLANPLLLAFNLAFLSVALFGTVHFSGKLQKRADQQNMPVPTYASFTPFGFAMRILTTATAVIMTIATQHHHPVLSIAIGFFFWWCIILSQLTTWPRRKMDKQPKEKRASFKFAYANPR